MARIDGDAGNNLEIGTSAPDRIRGFGGIDLLRGGSGDDTIEGGDGPDSLYGDQDNDWIEGGAGDDVLRGGRGSDTLNGGAGEDTIRSDRDDDLILGSAGADYINGGDGYDTVDYSDSPRQGGLLYDGVQVAVGYPTLIIPGIGGHAEGDILVSVEGVVGSAHDDRIAVDDAWSGSIFGDPIAHEVYGGDGDDELWGYGRDYLNGGPGNDTLATQVGGTAFGGPGADTFWLLGSVDGATIEDFDSAEGDVISLRSFAGLPGWPALAGFQHVTRSDVQAMLDGSRGNVLDLTLLGDADGYEHGSITLGGGVRVSDLTANDFILDGDTDPEPEPRPAVYDGTYDEIAYQLTDGYWRWTAEEDGDFGGRRAFHVAPGGTLSANITGLTAEGQQLARWALEAWTNVTGIEFEFVSGDANITFDDDEPGASAKPTELYTNGEIRKAHVNVSANWIEEHGATIDSDSFRTYIHEIGHALGLGHPGDYNATDDYRPNYDADAKFLNDSWQASVMSYFDQAQNTYIDANLAHVVTPMIADIVAVQNLYGFAVINPGDTVYGYESNVGGYLGQLFAAMSNERPDADVYAGGPVALTIFDSGGHDRLDLRWDDDDQRVELSPEGISDVFGLAGNLIIARGTVIESYIAGTGDDVVRGGNADNVLWGNYGNDTLAGGAGDDWLQGGPGADRLEGGEGADGAFYEWSDAGVRVNLGTGATAGGDAQGDSISGVEHLQGSQHHDTLTGDGDTNWLWGGPGNDQLAGLGGDDYLAGGEGDDVLLGGRGDDTFAFGPEPNGEDVIRDFGDGRGEQDVIELEGDFSFDSLTLTASGNDAVITGSGEAGSIHVTLENYLVDHEMSDLGSDDFLFS